MNLKSLSNFISAPGALLVLIFFFLPWISVSCGDIKLADSSGFQLASNGMDSDEMEANMASMSEDMFMEGFSEGDFGTEFTDPGTITTLPDEVNITTDPLSSSEEPGFMKADAKLYAIPLIGLIGLGLAGLGIYQSRFLNMYSAAGAFIVPSIIGIGLMVMKYMQIHSDMSDANGEMEAQMGTTIIAVNYEIGWWLSAAGLILMFIAGVLVFLETEDPAASRKLTPAERAKLEQVDGLLAQQRFTEAQAILQTVDHPIARQVLSKINAPSPTPRSATATNNGGNETEKLQQAKDLIIQKRYSEARMILYGVQNPTAQKWLAKLDEIEKK